ncbi:MAG: XkdF-like putative serine protease domain-containing protein [Clostridium sp.]|nr:XkdF-like putative serine protease domain-containing protein [Clostridium sp.]
MSEIAKTRCISDARIEFVSLVDKAANKKSFLIAKAENGSAGFSSFGRIVKTDSESHYVTGIVYEPMTEDSQGDFMTESEIQKAAVWFMKNGSGIDLQHNFKKFENAAVVESMVTKSDCEIGGEKIRKGTWLMTVEITDDDVWSAVEKGEITGFSMGGKGCHPAKR